MAPLFEVAYENNSYESQKILGKTLLSKCYVFKVVDGTQANDVSMLHPLSSVHSFFLLLINTKLSFE